MVKKEKHKGRPKKKKGIYTKQYTLKIENVQQAIWVETGVIVTMLGRNQQNKTEFANRKTKQKQALIHKWKKMKIKWAKEKQS